MKTNVNHKNNNNNNNNNYNNFNNLFCCYDLFILTYDDLSNLSTMNCIMIFGIITLGICCVLSICKSNQNKYKQNKTIKYNVIKNETENLNGIKIIPTYSKI